MRTAVDALRSLKKYTALALGPEWEVRLAGEEGTFHRPFSRVGASAPARLQMVNVLTREIVQPFSIVCHPVEKYTPDEARLEAARVQGLLIDAFTVGVWTPAYRVVGGFIDSSAQPWTTRRGHPLRVPLWNYDGVGLDEAVPDDARDPGDFMRVTENPTVNVIADGTDELLYAVAAAVTMSWVLSAAVLSEAMPVQHVIAESEES